MAITEEKIGLRIKEIRNYKGISQETLALESGLDRTYINSLEKGKRNVTISTLCKITGALNISLTKFFDDEISFESKPTDRVFLLSCDETNYNRTMIQGVKITEISKYFSTEDFIEIKNYAENGIVYIWGTSSNNNDKFKNVDEGNICIFSRNKTIISKCTLLYKCNSIKFSKKNWTNKKNEETVWPNIFIMSKPTELNIPAATLLAEAGYKKTFVQGFTIPSGTHNIKIKEYINKI